MLAPQRAQDVVLDVVAGDGVHAGPALLVAGLGALVVGGQAVLELEAGLAPGNVAVAAMDEDVGEGLDQVGLQTKDDIMISIPTECRFNS